MTQPQATAEVFYTAFQALKKSEREAFINRLLEDEKLAEDLRYAAVIEKRNNEPTVSLDDWTKLNERLRTLQNKLDVVTSIQTGIKEVKEARKSKQKLQTLSDFINESRS
jgi:phage shock protein A